MDELTVCVTPCYFTSKTRKYGRPTGSCGKLICTGITVYTTSKWFVLGSEIGTTSASVTNSRNSFPADGRWSSIWLWILSEDGDVLNKHPTSVAVLNRNVERARALVRTGCPVGIRIIAEGLNMANRKLGQFNNRFKHEKSVCRNCPRESEWRSEAGKNVSVFWKFGGN